jgi:REP element-mobilizing transposase RayT
MREIIRRVRAEIGVTIINGALSCDHVHMVVEILPHIWANDFVRRAMRYLDRHTRKESPMRSPCGRCLLSQKMASTLLVQPTSIIRSGMSSGN